MSELSTEKINFDHVNLKDIDPNAAEVPDAKYTFQVAGVEKKSYSNDKGSGEYFTVRLAITNSPKFNGRSYFESLFANRGTLKQLRRVMDATGIQQGSMTIPEWLNELKTAGARFEAPLITKEELDKRTSPPTTFNKQHVNLWEVGPAS